jgi:hypothetical protein
MQYQHTIAQPVCNKTLHNLLRQQLDEYFVDTLIPMAHSVQIVPSVEYCVRLVIEYAILSVLLKAEEDETSEDRKSRMRVLVVQQQAIVDEWRDKCPVQMLDNLGKSLSKTSGHTTRFMPSVFALCVGFMILRLYQLLTLHQAAQ